MKIQTCDACKSAYVGKYFDSGKESKRRCLAHLPNGVEEVEFDRYEHLILKEIKESLPNSEYYEDVEIISPKYDRTLMKGVRQRPDLIIRSPLKGSSVVIVEVDEGYHDNPKKKLLDIEREEFFRSKLTEEYKKRDKPTPKISFVRIEPFDGKLDSIVEKITKMTLSPGRKSEKVVKSGKFDEVIKTSISEIRKKLTRRAPGTETLQITPSNYTSYQNVRSPLNSTYSKFFPRRRSTLDRETKKTTKPLSFNKNAGSSSKLFTEKQKKTIADLIETNQDYTDYVRSIYGNNAKQSSINLSYLDSIKSHLHVIQGAALGYSDADLMKGVEKIRKFERKKDVSRTYPRLFPKYI